MGGHGFGDEGRAAGIDLECEESARLEDRRGVTDDDARRGQPSITAQQRERRLPVTNGRGQLLELGERYVRRIRDDDTHAPVSHGREQRPVHELDR